MLNRTIAALVTAAALTACQTPPDIAQLENQNASLVQRLDQANAEIRSLKATQNNLQAEKAELSRVIGVLGQEKSSHVESSINLRGDVRAFVQQQVDGLKQFLLDSDLLDYVGGERVDRQQLDEQALLVVDLANPAPRSGVLTGVGGYFKQTGAFTVKVLRGVDKQLVVIWESQPITVAEVGAQSRSFNVSVGIEKGDFIAYQFPAGGMVGFDRGTGDSRVSDELLTLGGMLRYSELGAAGERRSYSIGVFGLLNRE